MVIFALVMIMSMDFNMNQYNLIKAAFDIVNEDELQAMDIIDAELDAFLLINGVFYIVDNNIVTD